MLNQIERLKWLLLVFVPKLLNERYLAVYIICLSRLNSLATKRDRIVSIQKISVDGYQIFQIKCTDGSINIPKIQRATRFVSGIDFALSRLFKQYVALSNRAIFHNQETHKVIFDIGANIGEFSLYVLKNSTMTSVLAFEPDPIAYACLKANLHYWLGDNGACTINKALSSSIENRTLFVSSKNADTSLFPPIEITDEIEISTEILSNYISEIDQNKTVLLKMDAEGAEPEVLIGAGEHLERISFLTIDVSPERMGDNTLIHVSEILESRGYDVQATRDNSKRIFVNAKQRRR